MRYLRAFLWFFAGCMFSLYAQLSYADFSPQIIYSNVGWNFGILFNDTGTCTSGSAPVSPPGLSYENLQSLMTSVQASYSSTGTGSTVGCATGVHQVTKDQTVPVQSNATTFTMGVHLKCAGTTTTTCTGTATGLLNSCPSGYSVAANPSDSTHSYCKSNTAICPSNSTASGPLCVCNSGYTQTSGNQCVATGTACTSTAVADGPSYYDVGTDSSKRAPAVACVGGCLAIGSGTSSVSKSSIVSGATHYYAGLMTYTYAGGGATDTCNPALDGSQSLSGFSTPPTPTCGSSQYMTVGTDGNTYCYDSSGNQKASGGASVGCGDTFNTAKTSNPDGSTTLATTVTDTCTGATKTTYEKYAAGVTPPSVPASGSGGGGVGTSFGGSGSSGGGGGSGPTGSSSDPMYTTEQTPGQDMSAFCTANPTASACQAASAGSAAATGTLYTPDGTGKTFSSVLTAAKTTMQGSAWYSGATGLFGGTLSTGSCSGMSTTFDIAGHSFTVDLSFLCGTEMTTFYGYLYYPMLLVATMAAFAVAIL